MALELHIPDEMEAAFGGWLLGPADEGYDDARRVHNGDVDKRPALIARLRGHRRRGGRGRSRPRWGARAVRARRRPQRGGQGRHRRRPHDRSGAGPWRPRRSPRRHGPRPGRRHVARVQPGHRRARAGHHRRGGVDHRHRRPHPRRGAGVADGPPRARHRQPGLGRGGDRRRRGGHRQRGPRARSLLGAAGWRRELRRRDVVRVPRPSAHDGAGRRPGPSARRRRRGLRGVPAGHEGRARRPHRLRRDGGFPRGAGNYWKSAFFTDLSDAVVRTMADAFAATPTPMCAMVIEHFHGAVTRVAPEATAFPHREPGYNLALVGQWEEPRDAGAVRGWVRDTLAALQPHMADRRYVNYLAADDPADAVRSAYGANYDRLVEIKRRWDPDNLFRLNQHIDPSA